MKFLFAMLACCLFCGTASATVVFTSDDTYTVGQDGTVISETQGNQ
jgi:hypothetical protein